MKLEYWNKPELKPFPFLLLFPISDGPGNDGISLVSSLAFQGPGNGSPGSVGALYFQD